MNMFFWKLCDVQQSDAKYDFYNPLYLWNHLTESFFIYFNVLDKPTHTTQLRNNMWPECGHKIDLWDYFLFWKKSYAENLKKIVGAV